MTGLLAVILDNQFYPIVMDAWLVACGNTTIMRNYSSPEKGGADQQLERFLTCQVVAVLMLSATLSSAHAHEYLDAARSTANLSGTE